MSLQLKAREVYAPKGGSKSLRIHCHAGLLWITCKGDLRDYLINEGQIFEVRCGRHLVIMALDDSRIRVEAVGRLFFYRLGTVARDFKAKIQGALFDA